MGNLNNRKVTDVGETVAFSADVVLWWDFVLKLFQGVDLCKKCLGSSVRAGT